MRAHLSRRSFFPTDKSKKKQNKTKQWSFSMPKACYLIHSSHVNNGPFVPPWTGQTPKLSLLFSISLTSWLLSFLQKHEDICQYGNEQCQACGESVERRHLEQHRTKDCINRAVACTYCGGEVLQSNMEVRNTCALPLLYTLLKKVFGR